MDENLWKARWSKDQIKAMILEQLEVFWKRDTGVTSEWQSGSTTCVVPGGNTDTPNLASGGSLAILSVLKRLFAKKRSECHGIPETRRTPGSSRGLDARRLETWLFEATEQAGERVSVQEELRCIHKYITPESTLVTLGNPFCDLLSCRICELKRAITE